MDSGFVEPFTDRGKHKTSMCKMILSMSTSKTGFWTNVFLGNLPTTMRPLQCFQALMGTGTAGFAIIPHLEVLLCGVPGQMFLHWSASKLRWPTCPPASVAGPVQNYCAALFFRYV